MKYSISSQAINIQMHWPPSPQHRNWWISISDWEQVQKVSPISHDFLREPFRLKTNTIKSDAVVYIELHNNHGALLHSLSWRFSDRTYTFSPCTGEYTSPLQHVPQQIDTLTWTISRSRTALTLRCCGVVVVEYLFGGELSGEECVASQGQVVDHVTFGAMDTATTFYKYALSFGR